MAFYPKITAKQEGGDDGYCYVVRLDGREMYNGLTRHQLDYYKGQALIYWYGMRLREEFPALNGIESEALAREFIKANAEQNYKTPRKPIEHGCCSLAISIKGINDRACYCPIHGKYPGGIRQKKAVLHG